MGIWDNNFTEPAEVRGISTSDNLLGERYSPAKVMQWDSGDLSLIKGVIVQGEAARGAANQRSRRVLKHMRYDKNSGHFVPTEKRKLNRMVVGYQVNQDNHRVLQEMLNNANGV